MQITNADYLFVYGENELEHMLICVSIHCASSSTCDIVFRKTTRPRDINDFALDT